MIKNKDERTSADLILLLNFVCVRQPFIIQYTQNVSAKYIQALGYASYLIASTA